MSKVTTKTIQQLRWSPMARPHNYIYGPAFDPAVQSVESIKANWLRDIKKVHQPGFDMSTFTDFGRVEVIDCYLNLSRSNVYLVEKDRDRIWLRAEGNHQDDTFDTLKSTWEYIDPYFERLTAVEFMTLKVAGSVFEVWTGPQGIVSIEGHTTILRAFGEFQGYFRLKDRVDVIWDQLLEVEKEATQGSWRLAEELFNLTLSRARDEFTWKSEEQLFGYFKSFFEDCECRHLIGCGCNDETVWLYSKED